jgi:hypothetical protein
MRRAIIVTAILIGLVPLLIMSALHFLPSPKNNAVVSGNAAPNGLLQNFSHMRIIFMASVFNIQVSGKKLNSIRII